MTVQSAPRRFAGGGLRARACLSGAAGLAAALLLAGCSPGFDRDEAVRAIDGRIAAAERQDKVILDFETEITERAGGGKPTLGTTPQPSREVMKTEDLVGAARKVVAESPSDRGAFGALQILIDGTEVPFDDVTLTYRRETPQYRAHLALYDLLAAHHASDARIVRTFSARTAGPFAGPRLTPADLRAYLQKVRRNSRNDYVRANATAMLLHSVLEELNDLKTAGERQAALRREAADDLEILTRRYGQVRAATNLPAPLRTVRAGAPLLKLATHHAAVLAASPGAPMPRICGRRLPGTAVKCVEPKRGEVILLHYWATWCAPCMVDRPFIATLARTDPQTVRVVGISVDDDFGALTDFLAANPDEPGDQYHVAMSDPSVGRVGVSSYPTYLVIDGDGVIRARVGGGITPHKEADFEAAFDRVRAAESRRRGA